MAAALNKKNIEISSTTDNAASSIQCYIEKSSSINIVKEIIAEHLIKGLEDQIMNKFVLQNMIPFQTETVIQLGFKTCQVIIGSVKIHISQLLLSVTMEKAFIKMRILNTTGLRMKSPSHQQLMCFQLRISRLIKMCR